MQWSWSMCYSNTPRCMTALMTSIAPNLARNCVLEYSREQVGVFDHPWLRDWGIEERWDKRWIDNFTAWRLNGNLASFEDGLKCLPWTPAKACYHLNLSIKSGSNLEAGLYCCELSESGIRSLGPSRLPLFFLIGSTSQSTPLKHNHYTKVL